MSWTFVLRPREVETFRSCRRQWDFGARVRQNYVPVVPGKVFDFDKAVHVSLAAYYFPAMDDWNRSIVRPLAIQGFERAMREDRAAYEEAAAITPEQEQEWEQHLALGTIVLNRYFDWAIPNDDFESILADEDLWVPVADPARPGFELGTLDERPVRYFGRVEQLISDPNDEYWVVDHRVVWDDWEDDDTLLDDPTGLQAQWALEVSYPQLVVAGTIYNEIRIGRHELAGPRAVALNADGTVRQVRDLRDMSRGVRHLNIRRSPLASVVKEPELQLPGYPLGAAAAQSGDDDEDPDTIFLRDGNEHVRRTFVRRSRRSIRNVALDIARDVVEMRPPDVDTSPNPSDDRCATCAYAKPCHMLDEGLDIGQVMASEYRRRSREEFEEEGLRWSPTRRAKRASLGGVSEKSTSVRFHWG